MERPRTIDARVAFLELSEGDRIELFYPSSETGEPKFREGRIEKLDEKRGLITVDNEKEGTYRSFRTTRICDGTIKILK